MRSLLYVKFYLVIFYLPIELAPSERHKSREKLCMRRADVKRERRVCTYPGDLLCCTCVGHVQLLQVRVVLQGLGKVTQHLY